MTLTWPTKTLEQLVDPSRPITYGVVKPGDHDDNGITFVRGGDIWQGRIALNELRTITAQVSAQYKRTLLRGGELLLSLVGNPGEVAIAPPSLAGANIARQVGLVSLGDEVVPQYVMYYFMSPSGRAGLGAHMKGSVQVVINLVDLRRVEVPIPSLSTQRKIAAILSAYDDLIVNNLRRIKILEEMAQSLYREWFVKFRSPGHQHARLVDSPLGPIPEGWAVNSLGELCVQMQSGGTPSRKKPEFWGRGTIDWYKTMELWDTFLFSSEEKITSAGLKGSSARLYEAGTVLMAIYGSPTVGRLGILTRRAACNQAALGMVANPALASQQFLFYVLYELRGHFNSIAQGAAQQNISKAKVADAQCILPPVALINRFTTLVAPVWGLVENLRRKNEQLRRTRDLLLPKLISGELDVSELDIAVVEPA